MVQGHRIPERLLVDHHGFVDPIFFRDGVPVVIDDIGEISSLLPLGRQGHVLGRHSEGASRIDVRTVGRELPALELVAVFRRLSRGDRNRIAGCIELLGFHAPGAAVQLVGHDVVGHVLRVEVHILSDSVGERDIASGQVGGGAPRHQAVLAAVDGLLLGQLAQDFGDAHLRIRAHGLGVLLRILILPSVTQPELNGSEVLRLDHHRAVHVVPVIARNLIGDEGYALDVVLRDIAALHCPLVRIKDDLPMRTFTRDDAVLEAVGPLDNAVLLGGDEAVLFVDPHGPPEVNLSRAHLVSPLAGAVGVRIRVGALQVVEVRLLTGLRSRHSDFVFSGNRGSIGVRGRSADGYLALCNASHSAPVVYRSDGRIVRSPDDLTDRSIGREFRGQVD